LEADFVESGWIRIMTFDRGGASLPKRTTGAISENLKVEPSSFLGSGPSSCYREKKAELEKGTSKIMKKY
jgi:hypothetical protein